MPCGCKSYMGEGKKGCTDAKMVYGEGACIIAGMQLLASGFHDIAALDCEKYRLTQLVEADAAPWDNIATACISPTTLTDAADCNRIPILTVNNIAAFPLYNRATGEAFFALQTSIPMHDCNAWFRFAPGPGQCSCTDITALKTLGSPVRDKMIALHIGRADAADAIRARRKKILEVIQRAIDTVLAASPAVCATARALYAEHAPPVAGVQNA